MTSSEYAKVKDLMSPEDFDAKVKAKAVEWAGLLDDKTASLLVLDEIGRLDVAFTKIKDIQDAREVSVRARVTTISPVREFVRRTGEGGRVVNIQLDDGSGRCLLVLWDDDVRLVEQGYIKADRVIRALDCYVRVSNFGPEISRGKFGSIVAED